MDVVERLSLEAATANTLTACEHAHRYEFAAHHAAGKRTVDLACGVGYGAATLAERAGSVLGVDNDAATIDAARHAYGDRVEFMVADAIRYLERLESDDLDLLVCFEGLEHLPRLDAVAAALHRLAADGVQMVLSVPNSKTFGERNDFHLTDFSPELVEEFVGGFDDVVVLAQYLAEGSVISRREGSLDEQPTCQCLLGERAEPDYANHFLMLVNIPEAEALPGSDARMQLAVAPEHNRWMLQLERANRELWAQNARLARDNWGVFDAAAASMLDKTERGRESTDQLFHRAEAAHWEAVRWRGEIEDAWRRAQVAEYRLASLRRRKVVRLALALARLRPGAKSG